MTKYTSARVSELILKRINGLRIALENEKGRTFSQNDIIGLLLDLYDDCKKKKEAK